jgi:hypothetical protein
MSDITEGQFLSQYRREGRDAEFQSHLLHRRVRILGAVVVRDLVAPWADPVCDWLERAIRRIARIQP